MMSGSVTIHLESTMKQSAAFTFVEHLWDNAQQATGHSWTRLNGAMSETVDLAVRAGLEFDERDIGRMYKAFRGEYWFGEQNGDGWYVTAIKYANESACKAIEAYRDRKPFVFDGTRLAVGSNIRWPERGVDVGTVTSFKDSNDAIVVCYYAFDEATCQRSRTPTKRFTFTHAEIAEREKQRKADVSLNNDMSRIRDTFQRYANDGVFKSFFVDNALFSQIEALPKAKRAAVRKWCDRWYYNEPIPDALSKIIVSRGASELTT
jgi:hypothetical protein